MPTAAPRYCANGFCRTLVKSGRCEKCKAARWKQQDENRPNFRQRGYKSGQWERFRALVLYDEPLCRECMKTGKLTPARVVDHIVAVAKGGAMWDRDNVQPLCDPCNQKKSIAEDGWLGRPKTP